MINIKDAESLAGLLHLMIQIFGSEATMIVKGVTIKVTPITLKGKKITKDYHFVTIFYNNQKLHTYSIKPFDTLGLSKILGGYNYVATR